MWGRPPVSVPPPYSPSAAGRGTMPEHGNRAAAVGRRAAPRGADIFGAPADGERIASLPGHAPALAVSDAALPRYL